MMFTQLSISDILYKQREFLELLPEVSYNQILHRIAETRGIPEDLAFSFLKQLLGDDEAVRDYQLQMTEKILGVENKEDEEED